MGWTLFSAAPAKEQLRARRKADLVGKGGGAGFFSARDRQQRMTARKGWEQAPCTLLWVLADGLSRWVAMGKFYYRDSGTT